jgi:hypothetical protein
VRVLHVAITQDTFQGTGDSRRIKNLLKLGNLWEHIIAGIAVVPVDRIQLVTNTLMKARIITTIEHHNTIADELTDLLVI